MSLEKGKPNAFTEGTHLSRAFQILFKTAIYCSLCSLPFVCATTFIFVFAAYRRRLYLVWDFSTLVATDKAVSSSSVDEEEASFFFPEDSPRRANPRLDKSSPIPRQLRTARNLCQKCLGAINFFIRIVWWAKCKTKLCTAQVCLLPLIFRHPYRRPLDQCTCHSVPESGGFWSTKYSCVSSSFLIISGKGGIKVTSYNKKGQ